MLNWMRSVKRWLGFCDGWHPERVADVDKQSSFGYWWFHDWEMSPNGWQCQCRRCGLALRNRAVDWPFMEGGWHEESESTRKR